MSITVIVLIFLGICYINGDDNEKSSDDNLVTDLVVVGWMFDDESG